MSKSQQTKTDTRYSPKLLMGDRMTYLFVTETAELLGNSRPVNRPLERLSDSVNRILQFYFKKNAICRLARLW
jgi:hypothetical protein